MTHSDGSADRPTRRVSSAPEVPGVSLRSRLRDAGAGELWAAQFERTGAECVVRRVRLAPDPVLRSAALAAAQALADLDHPHLVPMLTALPTSDGLALITEPVTGAVSVARLLAARGELDPGEVVTIGLPVAQALAAAHAAGIVHGRLEREDILLEPTGRPLLMGLGVAALAEAARPDPVPPGAAAADVRDLAALLLASMRDATGPGAAAVAVALATALVDDPNRRTNAAELAAELARSATPLPVRLVAPIAPDQSGVAPVGAGSLPPRPDSGADPRPGRGERPGPVGTGPAGGAPSAGAAAAGPAAAGTGRSAGRTSTGGAGTSGAGTSGGTGGVYAGDAGQRSSGGTRPRADPVEDGGVGGGGGDRGISGATSRDAAELLGSLPPPPRRSTRDRRTGRDPGRGKPSARDPRKDRPAGGRGVAGGTASGSGGGERVDGGASTGGGAGGGGAAGGRAGSGGGTGSGSKGWAGKDRTAGGRSARAGARRARWVIPVTAGVGLFAVVVAAVLLATSPSDKGGNRSAATQAPTGGVSAPGDSGRDTTASPIANQSPEQIWRGVLGSLNTARSRAFEQGSEALLAESNAPGSPALNADLELMRQVVARGLHTSPIRTVIDQLAVRSDTPERTVLRVTDHLDAWDYLDASGRVIGRQQAKPAAQRDLVLVRTSSGWRVSESLAVTAG